MEIAIRKWDRKTNSTIDVNVEVRSVFSVVFKTDKGREFHISFSRQGKRIQIRETRVGEIKVYPEASNSVSIE